MNSKAFELAISTLVLIVIGVLILIGIIYAISGGFEKFASTTKPFTDTTASTATKQACLLACQSQDKITFCCTEHEINNQKIKCYDNRLDVSCQLDCSEFNCE